MGCGGHAYINSFNSSVDTPVFVYNSSLLGVAEASSHEVGHSVGLAHDGAPGTTYYRGHGSGEQSWAPIMGVGYYEAVTQWSKGEYYGATNSTSSGNYGKGPDDLAVITTYYGFGYRADDHSDSIVGASPLVGGSVLASGVIEQTGDIDIFEFTVGGGNVVLDIDPDPVRPNLNLLARILNATGSPVATSNSTSSLSASFNLNLAAGIYYLEVDGTGTGSPLTSSPTGYTEYGSLGQYTVSGTVPSCTPDGVTPGAPLGIAAGPDDINGWIDLTWTDAGTGDPTVGYRVYRGGSEIATTPTRSYRDDTVANGVSYSYYVTAYDDCYEESGASDTVVAAVFGADRAAADSGTTYGSVSGTFESTWDQDDAYQSLSETHSGGKKKNRHDRAEHKWRFDLSGGNSVFNVDAHMTTSSDGDTGFDFEWSTSASGPWRPLLTITKTSDDDAVQWADLGAVAGTVYVRAFDNDRTGNGSYSYNTLRVDQMYFDGGAPVTNPPPPATNPSPANGATGVSLDPTLNWSPSFGADSYTVCFGLGTPSDCTAGLTDPSFAVGPLAATAGYAWRVDAVNVHGTTASPVWTFTTQGAAATVGATYELSTASGSRGKKYGVVTVTVTDDLGNPVAGALVYGVFSGDFSDTPDALTDASGVVIFTTANTVKKPKWGFCIGDITGTALPWDLSGSC